MRCGIYFKRHEICIYISNQFSPKTKKVTYAIGTLRGKQVHAYRTYSHSFPLFCFYFYQDPMGVVNRVCLILCNKKNALMVEENHIDLFPGSKYIWFQANDLLACWVFALELYEWNGGLALMLHTSLNIYIYILKIDVIFFIGYKQNCVCNKQSLDGSPVWYNPFIVISYMFVRGWCWHCVPRNALAGMIFSYTISHFQTPCYC